MTKCKRCGNWFDWYGTQVSDVFEEGVKIAQRLGLGIFVKTV